MKSLFVTALILGVLLCVGCISWKSPTLDVGRGHSFYLRSIETGRLYGPYSGEENPPGGAEFQVLLSVPIRKLADYRNVPIGRILWAQDYQGQPLSHNEKFPIEIDLEKDRSFLQIVFSLDVGQELGVEDETGKHAWRIISRDADEALLVRSDYDICEQTHLRPNELQVHEALTGHRMEVFSVNVASIHEVIASLERQAADALKNAGITFSVKGDWSQPQNFRFGLADPRIIDLLEHLREVYGILYRIDGTVIQLWEGERGN